MTAIPAVRSVGICLLLVACGGGERSTARAPSDSAGAGPRAPATSATSAPPTSSRPALRDPVELSATADIDGRTFRFAGPGECQHTADASIYEVPASMWAARVSDDGGTLSYLNLTVWQPTGAPTLQVSLGLTGGGQTSEIATVKGSALRGSGTGRIEPKGQGGALVVEGQDAAGHAVKVRVDCSRFTEPVAEGG